MGKGKQYKENGKDTLQRVLSTLIMQRGWGGNSQAQPLKDRGKVGPPLKPHRLTMTLSSLYESM